MSVTAVSAISAYSQDPLQQQNGLRQDLLTLQTALSASNVAKAQQALAHFQEDLQSVRPQQNGIRASAQVNPQSAMRADLQALQSALDSGDLAMAEEAFVRVLQDTHKIAQPQAGLNPQDAKALPNAADGGGENPAAAQTKTDGKLIDVMA